MIKAVSAGDIPRDQWPSSMADHINLYMGSGRMGACFDAWGLMDRGLHPQAADSISNTVITHAGHWHRGAWGLDYWLPVARIGWHAKLPPVPDKWSQRLTLLDGRLTTELEWPGLRCSITGAFNPGLPDLLALAVSYEASSEDAMPPLVLAPETNVHTHYDQHIAGTAETAHLAEDACEWIGRVRAGTADSALALRIISTSGKAALAADPHGVKLAYSGSSGRHLILIGVTPWAERETLWNALLQQPPAEQYLAAAASAWRKRWGDSFIEVPVPEYQALWARSAYYVLSSFAPEVRAPAPPCAWSGNAWPFGFPQDLSYIHPALLRLGHFDIAKSWVEFYASRIDDTRRVTRRVYNAEGTMWAWEHPIGPDTRMLEDGTPNWCQFEIHNAAYPARMAADAARYVRDPVWTREAAWPVVLESARFFSSILKPQDSGGWGIHLVPSFGQDEMGGKDAANYLCSLFSAKYTLEQALRMSSELKLDLREAEKWKKVLSDGLAFDRLLDPATGLWVTCEGLMGTSQMGNEKHPVQLNPLTFLPMGEPAPEVVKAYNLRQDLCAGVKKGFYHGWTLGAFWLAAAHMTDAEGLEFELSRGVPSGYIDPDYIQIYEGSNAKGLPFYVTTHGLYLQALQDAIVSDYYGFFEIGSACPPSWEQVRFANLHTTDAVISGEADGGHWRIQPSPHAL